jgi:3-oxoacyl-[acyl-carrier-protein] synthase-3
VTGILSTDCRARIAAIDYALPGRRVSNAMLADMHPGWQMEQVVLRTGVKERYWCKADETALDLADIACRKVLARAGWEAREIDAVLFCTQSPDQVMPPNACLLQARLGLSNSVAALDFSLACSGFIYGLYLAKALVESGAARRVLLVTGETYSKWMHPDDRGPITLFGDGAAATLIEPGRRGIESILVRTNGHGAEVFRIPAGGARQPSSQRTKEVSLDASGNARSAEHIHMDGAAVLDFVKKEIPPLVKAVLGQARLGPDDFDLAVFHQASKVTLDFLNRALHIPASKQFSNLATVGNTVSASIPIALRDAETQGVLRPGMRVLLTGFGVGLSWGGCVLTW